MADPATHYHRVETYDIRQDTMYYLARLDGGIVRLEAWMKERASGDIALHNLITMMKAHAASLRNSLSSSHYDVV